MVNYSSGGDKQSINNVWLKQKKATSSVKGHPICTDAFSNQVNIKYIEYQNECLWSVNNEHFLATDLPGKSHWMPLNKI